MTNEPANFLKQQLDGAVVEWKPLGNIADVKRGTSITRKDVGDGNVPVIAGGRTPAYFHNVSNREGQTIAVAGSGAYAGFVSWWERPIFISDAFSIQTNNTVEPKYCYYWLKSLQKKLYDLKSGSGVPHIYPRDVIPLQIPIPCPDDVEKSLAIQGEIVRFLDRFTELTTELTAELTIELALRKKQYNYHLNKFFNFEENDVR